MFVLWWGECWTLNVERERRIQTGLKTAGACFRNKSVYKALAVDPGVCNNTRLYKRINLRVRPWNFNPLCMSMLLH